MLVEADRPLNECFAVAVGFKPAFCSPWLWYTCTETGYWWSFNVCV